ncbi:uncharacterized protein KIAA1143 homolog [Daktulosphaira vitifoliae]|uniref:uncharacterized protein KIAA1143 homolog n=1 Tax=Daktulosphaira vitifoliae TaxID=58002 RepID=UPI0021A97C11|nr:uncharacterized protein KIAA1143 homolog [Daktulosphaira vitifoliae]
MSKRNNINYIKPKEPSFITKLKEEINYKEGPTVDTKKVALPAIENESYEDDYPTVVVLKEGDLTAEQALKEKLKKEEEEKTKPADLTKRIIFKRPAKSTPSSEEKHRVNKKTKRSEKLVLSFDDEEEDL